MGYLSTAKIELTTAWVQIAAANQPVLFQRVSGYDVIYQIAEEEPDESSEDGHRLNDYLPLDFTANNPVWARSVGDSVLFVSTGAESGVPIDKSSTITTGGEDQILAAANPLRKGIEFYNNSTGSLWINVIGTATASGGSIEVRAGGYWSPPICPVTAISIFGATNAQAFTCWEYL